MNKSKKIEVSEIIKPNIINGLDVTSSLATLLEGVRFLSFLKRRLEKGFITIKFLNLITLKFEINFYGNPQYFGNLLQV